MKLSLPADSSRYFVAVSDGLNYCTSNRIGYGGINRRDDWTADLNGSASGSLSDVLLKGVGVLEKESIRSITNGRTSFIVVHPKGLPQRFHLEPNRPL